MQFEWDRSKESANLRKHRIGFDEALTVFADPLAGIFEDETHSESEQREIVIGHSARQRLLIVSFTVRAERIRIISARRATQREREEYEQNT